MWALKGHKIWVAGHQGMVGSALVRRLALRGCDVITAGRNVLDLRRQSEVEAFFQVERPDIVILAAAKVGGILANETEPADFLYDNLMMEANVVRAAHEADVERLLLLGSSCIYPRLAPQPIAEEALLTGELEPTNEAYAVAKIAGVKLVQAYRKQHGRDYISAMPTNLYGPGDNFDLRTSHVLPALIRKAHEAKVRGDASMTLWGTGSPRRDLLHVDDCAEALICILSTYSDPMPINIGSGQDHSILELAHLVSDVVGFRGEIAHDLSKPDGTPRKLLNSSRLHALGWTPSIPLRDGVRDLYRWFLSHVVMEEPA
jgi:GDP-L-fucose synthase